MSRLAALAVRAAHRQDGAASDPTSAPAQRQELAASQAGIERQQHERRQMVRIRAVGWPLGVVPLASPHVRPFALRSPFVVSGRQRGP